MATLLAFLTLLFYAIIPLAGAYQVRHGWRRLRQWVTSAAASRPLTFQALQTIQPDQGPYRLVGALEAFEGRDTLWIGNDTVSVAVNLRGVEVYFLENPDEGAEVQDPPRKVAWTRLGVLPEGTRFVVWGHLTPGNSGATNALRFAAAPARPLLVVAFSGEETTVLERLVRDSRQPIEHWNPATPVSLVIGFAALLVASYWELRSPGARAIGLIGLALALLPSTFFLPPGIVFFYGFARLWAQSRQLRARRDVLVFRSQAAGAEARLAGTQARQREVIANVILLVGAGLNALLLVTLLRWTIP
ncbi:MAG: hypothetical protein WCG80_15340 [Spirochaetales bacterium]